MGQHKTVFARRHRPWEHPNEMAVTYSHRASFVLYCIYIVWAVVAGSVAIAQNSFYFTFWFAWSILPTAAVCALGALYFPRWARLEMSGAVILVTLLATFEANNIIFLFQDFDFGTLNNAILDLSFAVIPFARAAFVFFAFILTGKRNRENGPQQ